MYIPGVVIILLVAFLQRRRHNLHESPGRTSHGQQAPR